MNLLKNWKVFLGVVLIAGIFSTLALLPLPWNTFLTDFTGDLQYKLRGGRRVSDKIEIVFFGPQDLQSLGWPITRDYFGYLTHILHQAGAAVIGFDLLFDTHDVRYPEFDHSLADFFAEARNVCLPFTFSRITHRKGTFPRGTDPLFPIPELRHVASGLGFSNLGKETIIHRVPLVADYQDTLYLSFGVELARLFLAGPESRVMLSADQLAISSPDGKTFTFPLEKDGSLRLNHFGTVERVPAIGVVDLLKTSRSRPDSLHLSQKLVLVAVTSPGIAPVKVTPLSSAFPAALIHATVAENLLAENFLRTPPAAGKAALIIFVCLFLWVVFAYQRPETILYSATGFLLVYWVGSGILFSTRNWIVPLGYPTGAYLVTFLFLATIRVRERRRQYHFQKNLLEDQIRMKQEQLTAAQVALDTTQTRLSLELKKKEEQSQATRKLLESQRQKVILLEKQLQDLQAYSLPERRVPFSGFPEIIHSPGSKLVPVLDIVGKIGSDDIPVLIVGETGTGKEMIARAIHHSGARSRKPFVAVNCGALPETLLESELFGHEKGSFTGAIARRKGRFELANGGTLFLDEISETTPAFQAKLLRVLQEGTFERLGGEKSLHVDVRIIAASSKPLSHQVQTGLFREDLFYRLNGFPISIPPLRERTEDVPLLADHFLHKHGFTTISGFSRAAMMRLQQYPWPGNVRELENFVRRAAIMARSEHRRIIKTTDLPEEIFSVSNDSGYFPYRPFEDQVLQMLRAFKFSHAAIGQTARILGNRDRGTITEYLRGICFEQLVKNNFDLLATARTIADSSEEEVIARIKTKIEHYLNNLRKSLLRNQQPGDLSLRKGLPQKYHSYLDRVVNHLMSSEGDE